MMFLMTLEPTLLHILTMILAMTACFLFAVWPLRKKHKPAPARLALILGSTPKAALVQEYTSTGA